MAVTHSDSLPKRRVSVRCSFQFQRLLWSARQSISSIHACRFAMRVNTLTGRPPGLEAPASAALRAEIVGRSRADRQSHIDVQIAQAGARRNGDPVPDQRIDRVAITDLKSACRRTRKASKAQVARIKASVLRFGQVNPIIVDQDLNIINGHVVVAACIELDIRVVNVIPRGSPRARGTATPRCDAEPARGDRRMGL